ncbi:hypothetical protein [Palleronia marisminoris]|uniref:hypothetical protein n=1 Tax=Palleronia marisminoris TaxID=315423 RepID=UPI001C313975|nr:hypothetical protein [Palleronia marisminoris]
MDHGRIAGAGQSFGGHTCHLLLGARLQGENFFDPRIHAGVLLATPERGGSDRYPNVLGIFPSSTWISGASHCRPAWSAERGAIPILRRAALSGMRMRSMTRQASTPL